MNEKQKFAKNLKEILKRKGIEPSPSVIEREFHLRHYGKDITQHAIRKWLRGESLPTSERLQTLAKWLNVELTDLVSEERAYKIQKSYQIKKVKKPVWELAESYEDQMLFKMFVNLPKEQRKVIREVIIAMHRAYRQ